MYDSKPYSAGIKRGGRGNLKEQIVFHTAEYVRLSREDGDKAESDSIKNQKKLIENYIKGKSDFSVYDIYIDDGFSGTNFNRPAFCRMLEDVEKGKVNCVIVKDLSRFGRDYIDAGKYLERYFPDRNVRFISVTDNIDSFEQPYDMLLPIKNIFNEQYARDISRKIHASVLTKQKAGEFIGAFASYGYRKSLPDKNKLVIDPYAAQIVSRIFSLYLRGLGKDRIAAVLNEEGVLCPSEYKKVNGENYKNANRLEGTSYWTYSTVNRILQNELYIGNMVQGRKVQKMRGKPKIKDREEWIIVPGTHEPIIDKNTWEKTQDLLKRRTRNPNLKTNITVLAGFLRCGDCGRALVKKTGKNISYACGTYVRSGRQYCTPHRVSHNVLENILLGDLKKMLERVENRRELVDSLKRKSCYKRQDEEEKVKVISELGRVRRLKKAVYEDYKEELISRQEFAVYRQEYIKKEVLLEKQLACLEKAVEKKNVEDAPEVFWIRQLVEMGEIKCLDRNIVTAMLHEIRVYENHKIKVIYNFSDDAFKEEKDSAIDCRHMEAQIPVK